MRRHVNQLLGVLVSSAMVLTPAMNAFGANHYQAEFETVMGNVLFPEDSVSGVYPLYMAPDFNEVELENGEWTNRTSKAYRIESMEDQEGVLLQPVGYVLTVVGGTSNYAYTDQQETQNHFHDKEPQMEMTSPEEDKKDIAYYDAWTDVTVKAEPAKEGLRFDHWEVTCDSLQLPDPMAEEITFTMVEDKVKLEAKYTQADVMVDAPAEELMDQEVMNQEVMNEEFLNEELLNGESFAEDSVYEEIQSIEEVQEEPFGAEEGIFSEDPQNESVIQIDQMEGLEQTPESAPEQAPEPTLEPEPTPEPAPEQEIASEYHAVIENGNGTGDYEIGTEVKITADAIAGYDFSGWYTTNDSVWLADSLAAETTFYMPAEDVTVIATYLDAQGSITDDPIIDETELIPEEEESESEEVLFLPETEELLTEAQVMVPETEIPVIETEAPETEEETEVLPVETEMSTEAPVHLDPQPVPETEQPQQEVSESDDDMEVDDEEEEDIEEFDSEEADDAAEEIKKDEIPKDAPRYVIDLSSYDDITVVDAEYDEYGEIIAAKDQKITVIATEYPNRIFQGFAVHSNVDGSPVKVKESTKNYRKAYFRMPEGGAYVEALYEEMSDNEVQVYSGTGSGTYSEGDQVTITAAPAPQGQRFKNWTVITGNVTLANAQAPSTTFIMPDQSVQVIANYEVITYTLTVNYGTGSGVYNVGNNINLAANYPSEGREFNCWVVTSNNTSVAAPDRYYTYLTMPAADTTVEATYKDGPYASDNAIWNIEAGAEYMKGSTISFTAYGSGMDNVNPNPGDYRYRPSGYSIGNVNGGWSNAPYTTSMAINAVGEYTLYVTYTKDVFDGNTWNATQTTDTKSVTFHVVNALSVQTGDDTPVILMAAIAAVAAIVIIILAVVFIRRRR